MDPWTLLLIGAAVWMVFQAMQSGVAAGSTPAVAPPDSGAPVPGGPLSVPQIAVYAANAGFEGNDLLTAIAIALAESGGDPGAVGDLNITRGGSVGLWQINLRWHPQYTAQALVDPQTNADAAFQIFQAAGDSFSPWSTFKSGAYRSHLDVASSYLNA